MKVRKRRREDRYYQHPLIIIDHLWEIDFFFQMKNDPNQFRIDWFIYIVKVDEWKRIKVRNRKGRARQVAEMSVTWRNFAPIGTRDRVIRQEKKCVRKQKIRRRHPTWFLNPACLLILRDAICVFFFVLRRYRDNYPKGFCTTKKLIIRFVVRYTR